MRFDMPGHGIKLINGHYICPTFSLYIDSVMMDEWLYIDHIFPGNVPEWEQEDSEWNSPAWGTFSC